MMLLTSCVTTKIEEKIIVPEIAWPEFPVLASSAITDEYIIQLAKFKTAYELRLEEYNKLKELIQE